MHALAASITLFVTILLSFGLGIAGGYAVIWGILRAFGRHSRPRPKPVQTAVHAGD